MAGPGKITFDKLCWCGKTFTRGETERCSNFKKRQTCSDACYRVLLSNIRNGTPLIHGHATADADEATDFSCPNCNHTALDSDFEEPCKSCRNGSGFSRRDASRKVYYKEYE